MCKSVKRYSKHTKDLFGCFGYENKRDDANETVFMDGGLKEGGAIQILTTVLPLCDARSLSLFVFTYLVSMQYP